MTSRRRWRALGGIAGPATFITAWSVLGTNRAGYSPVSDPISRLAAVDASSRWAMTGGFVALGLGVGLFATELRRWLPGPAALTAATTAIATIGVASTPLESPLGGAPHALFAGIVYTSLAAGPVLSARPLAARGYHVAAAASLAVGIACGSSLLTSVATTHHTGLWQRIGLTVGDAWIISTAFVMATPRTPAPLASPGPSGERRTTG